MTFDVDAARDLLAVSLPEPRAFRLSTGERLERPTAVWHAGANVVNCDAGVWVAAHSSPGTYTARDWRGRELGRMPLRAPFPFAYSSSGRGLVLADFKPQKTYEGNDLVFWDCVRCVCDDRDPFDGIDA